MAALIYFDNVIAKLLGSLIDIESILQFVE